LRRNTELVCPDGAAIANAAVDGPMDSDPLAALVANIQQQIRDLPEVNTAAKLHALLGRVEHAVKHRTDMTAAATQLEQAANAALDDDPWVLFHRAAADLLEALAASSR